MNILISCLKFQKNRHTIIVYFHELLRQKEFLKEVKRSANSINLLASLIFTRSLNIYRNKLNH